MAEEVDGRHEHEPGEDAAGEHDGGDADADDVADAEIFRRAIGADGGAFKEVLRSAKVRLIIGFRRPQGEQVVVLEEGVEGAETEAEEDAGGEAAAALAGHEDVGTRRTLRVDQCPVLFYDQLAAQRDHEQDAEPTAEEGESEDSARLQVEA